MIDAFRGSVASEPEVQRRDGEVIQEGGVVGSGPEGINREVAMQQFARALVRSCLIRSRALGFEDALAGAPGS